MATNTQSAPANQETHQNGPQVRGGFRTTYEGHDVVACFIFPTPQQARRLDIGIHVADTQEKHLLDCAQHYYYNTMRVDDRENKHLEAIARVLCFDPDNETELTYTLGYLTILSCALQEPTRDIHTHIVQARDEFSERYPELAAFYDWLADVPAETVQRNANTISDLLALYNMRTLVRTMNYFAPTMQEKARILVSVPTIPPRYVQGQYGWVMLSQMDTAVKQNLDLLKAAFTNPALLDTQIEEQRKAIASDLVEYGTFVLNVTRD